MSKLIDIIKRAITLEITDLHFHEGKRPYVRQLTKIIKLYNEDIVVHNDFIEFFDSLEISNEKKDELHKNGSFDLGLVIPEVGNLRLNVYYQQNKLACSIRLLPSSIPSFYSLNLPEELLRITKMQSGLVLITGLTGTGKTTTIASLINEINMQQAKHIITIEDPIEYHYPEGHSLVSQREVGADCPNFCEGLRASLRQDPDVIVIGEMRDKETILTAIEAAESGHLVLSTLHTGSTASTIDRIISYFSDEEKNHICSKLSMILSVVVSQQLLVGKTYDTIYPCQEIMFMNDSIRNLIREGKCHQIYSFLQIGKDYGCITLEEMLTKLVIEEKITKETALSHCNNPSALEGYFRQYRIN
ncbi:MAG: PilT/PilU family type 4a pilus ATPase [Bacilli bacterium]|nr:PilT/PilU family type 4a pilus ATPase [Mollicutes bacterium]MDY3899610.1 PilT/PilU family type 4a pilus ATPase [Bacilli bacterium]